MATFSHTQNTQAEYSALIVVLITGMLEDLSDLARQIYYQAAAQQRSVLYLTLDNRKTDPLAASRQLTTITALTQGNTVQASALLVKADDWADALRMLTHPGDLVIWTDDGFMVPESLETELGINQQVLPTGHAYTASRPIPWLYQVAFWAVVLVILGGFSYLEYALAGVISGGALKASLIGLFVLEGGALYQCDKIFR